MFFFLLCGYNMPMTDTYPSCPEEYEEYCRVMNEIADEIHASTPDPIPESFFNVFGILDNRINQLFDFNLNRTHHV